MLLNAPKRREGTLIRKFVFRFSYENNINIDQANKTILSYIGVRAGGTRGAAAPPVLKIFGQNAYDSGKSTWDKLFIESSFYNTTKWSILKRLNGSVCCRSLDAGICCSFAPNFLANSQKAVECVRFVKSLLFK